MNRRRNSTRRTKKQRGGLLSRKYCYDVLKNKSGRTKYTMCKWLRPDLYRKITGKRHLAHLSRPRSAPPRKIEIREMTTQTDPPTLVGTNPVPRGLEREETEPMQRRTSRIPRRIQSRTLNTESATEIVPRYLNPEILEETEPTFPSPKRRSRLSRILRRISKTKK